MEKPKITVELNEYHHQCGDKCCDLYGQIVTVNGEELFMDSLDTATVVKELLTYLGHNVTVVYQYNGEEQYRLD